MAAEAVLPAAATPGATETAGTNIQVIWTQQTQSPKLKTEIMSTIIISQSLYRFY
jgi:hypothetical protein